MISIPFNQIEAFPKLVSDCTSSNAKIDFGFPTAINEEFWLERSRQEAKINRPLSELTEILHKQLDRFNPSDQVIDNIDSLNNPGTLAIVTGQQVGLGGGPLLTLYKAMSAVAYARSIEEKTGIKTVPIFWMATSDHNFNEAAQLRWLNLKNELVNITYTDDANKTPVGLLKLGDAATDLLEGLKLDLPESDFKPELISIIGKAYTPEHTYAEAFQQLGTDLLGHTGLIMFNPDDNELKKHTSDFWINVLNHLELNNEYLLNRTEEIESYGYKSQVPVFDGRPSMFLIENNKRRKIVLSGKNKHAQSEKILSVKDLLKIADDNPEKLSAGVTLRPLLQGYLLPTGAYIAGPHEMAYWGQLPGSFEIMNIPKPAVIHRTTLTLIESKIRKKLDKLNLSPEVFLNNSKSIINSYIKTESEYSLDTIFNNIHLELEKMFSSLLKVLELKPYNSMNSAVENASRKVEQQITSLEDKFKQRLLTYDKEKLDSLTKITQHLRPEGNLQERVISPHYYFARYGKKLIDGLINIADKNPGCHNFVDIEEII